MMIIYIVNSGDSLFLISEKIGVTTAEIIAANGLGTHPYLAVGQALIIPSVDCVMHANADYIIIPKGAGDLNAIQIYAESDRASVGLPKAAEELITGLVPVRYFVEADGGIYAESDETVWKRTENPEINLIMNITGRDRALIKELLSNADLQWMLIKNILIKIKENGFSGLQLDRGISSCDLPMIIGFLRNIMTIFKPLGIPVTVAIDPVYWNGTCSFTTLGRIADTIDIEISTICNPNRQPCAPAPLDLAEEIVSCAAAAIPPQKIMLGLSVCGCDWTLTSGASAKSIGTRQIQTIAARWGAKITYDEQAGMPFVDYMDDQDRQHRIWFEDVRSIYQKLQLIKKYGLTGINLNRITQDSLLIFPVLKQMFCLDAREYVKG